MEPSSAAETARTEEDVATQQSYLVLARHLRQLGRPILGLWPVPVPTVFDEVPRHLAAALASLGDTVGVVEPKERWSNDASQDQLLVSSLGDSVDSLTPVWLKRLSPAAAIEQTLALARDRYGLLLLDLAGLGVTDVHEVALVPGVGILFLVAQGRINEFALARLRRRMPAERLLGAVLVDAPQRRAVA
jgi:hypothetical protein